MKFNPDAHGAARGCARRVFIGLLTQLWIALPVSAGAWKGEASFGLVATRGNTEAETFNFSLALEYDRQRWRHRARTEALRATDSGETTAARYLLDVQSNYKLSDRDYVFANLRATRDLFSGIERQLSETVGYGRHWRFGTALRLEAQGGAGARQSVSDEDERKNEGIVRGAMFLRWSISKNAQFRQSITIESGKSNTLTESITSVTSTLVGNLGMSLRLDITRNSDVPVGTKNTDTVTSVNLVYNF